MTGETELYRRIRELVVTARQTVARDVDWVQVHTNFEIGRHIVEHEQMGAARADYGKEVIKNLAAQLTDEFGSGFSLSNLKLMRQFYLQFQNRMEQMGQTASAGSVSSSLRDKIQRLMSRRLCCHRILPVLFGRFFKSHCKSSITASSNE